MLPNAARNTVTGLENGTWRIKIAAPPDKGKANKELISYLSELLGIHKSSLKVIKGHTSQHKLLALEGLEEPEIVRRLLPG